jgi:hypothetical protein
MFSIKIAVVMCVCNIYFVPRSKYTPLRLSNQSVNAVQGSDRCLFWDPNQDRNTVWIECRILNAELGGRYCNQWTLKSLTDSRNWNPAVVCGLWSRFLFIKRKRAT